MKFGDKLRGLLEERGLSQKQVADDLNIAASTMGNYIRNLREPDFETVRCLADYFSVSTDYLLDHQTAKNLSASETELLRLFRSLNNYQQSLYLEQGRAFIRVNKTN